MARSVGVRPRKAQRAEFAVLKAKLSSLRSDQWLVAQNVFDHMCALCEVSGPSHGKMVPRSCRFCGFFGHTKQHCPALAAREERLLARELEAHRAGVELVQAAREAADPATQRCRDLMALAGEWWDAGRGCERGAHEGCACEDCARWRVRVEAL